MWKEDAFLLKTAKQVAQPWRTHSICIQFIFITYRNQTHTACTSNCMSIRPYFFLLFHFHRVVVPYSPLVVPKHSLAVQEYAPSFLVLFLCFLQFFENVIFTTFLFCLSFFRSFACLAAFICSSVNAHCMSLYLTLFQKLIPMEMYILAVHVAVAMPLPLPLCQHSSLTWAVCVVCSKQQALF